MVNADEWEDVKKLLEDNDKLPWEITEEHKTIFKEAYNFCEGNIPRCHFCDVMLKECGLQYGPNAHGY